MLLYIILCIILCLKNIDALYRHPVDKFYYEPGEPTFYDIMQRRNKFDIEGRMNFPTHTPAESQAEEYTDDQTAESDQSNVQKNQPDNQNDNNQPDNQNDNNQPDNQNNNQPDGQNNSQSDGQNDNSQSDGQNDDSQPENLSDGCLRCLCEASSDCDPQVRCHVIGPNDYYCGPFQINYDYWSDADKPGSQMANPMDFEECMNDIECSIDSVKNYMKKWARDCDGDNYVTCEDYARIHKAGPYGCNSTWVLKTPYYERFKDCYIDY